MVLNRDVKINAVYFENTRSSNAQEITIYLQQHIINDKKIDVASSYRKK